MTLPGCPSRNVHSWDHPARRVAVVGAGVAGLSAAWALSQSCDIALFDKADRAGGHTNTVLVESGGRIIPVDTGFIVFNSENYPNLTALFEHLGVSSQPAEMHFSVSARDRDLEYSSHGFSGLFADLRNLTRPRFFSMIADILRFYASAPSLVSAADDVSLGEFLRSRRYGVSFIQDHLLPMAAAIWSCPAQTMLELPVKSLARFFVNHGLATLGAPSRWRTVSGGSSSYISPLTASFRGSLRLGAEVVAVRREGAGAIVRLACGEEARFDDVVFACHGPQARSLLVDANEREREILSTFRTQPNRAVLHTDASLMPRRTKVWASWNYLSLQTGERDLSVTYWMNALQRLDCDTNFFVTLNPAIEPRRDSVIAEFDYLHPIFDAAALRGQREIWQIQGRRRAWWAGAYLGYGFHEDGVQSGLAIAEMMTGWKRPWKFDPAQGRLANRCDVGGSLRAAA